MVAWIGNCSIVPFLKLRAFCFFLGSSNVPFLQNHRLHQTQSRLQARSGGGGGRLGPVRAWPRCRLSLEPGARLAFADRLPSGASGLLFPPLCHCSRGASHRTRPPAGTGAPGRALTQRARVWSSAQGLCVPLGPERVFAGAPAGRPPAPRPTPRGVVSASSLPLRST